MTQQQVFSLYLANPNQRVRCQEHTYSSFALNINGYVSLYMGGIRSGTMDISDCKLILKRISNMSEEHAEEFFQLMRWVDTDDLKPIGYYRTKVIEFFRTGNMLVKVKYAGVIANFHYTHGYCIDESWITNGWVEIESEEK